MSNFKNVKTLSAKISEVQRNWYVVDASEWRLGHLSSQIAYMLRGKHKPSYTSHVSMSDYIVVINAHKIKLSSDKEDSKLYYRHTGYFGGIKSQTAGEIRAKQPHKLLEKAVKGMLAHNPLGRECFRYLKVYCTDTHPHGAQNPLPLPPRVAKSAFQSKGL
jgi:large subunit ribosomal protein L13